VAPRNQAVSDGESRIPERPLTFHRRENFDLARAVRANAHGMRLSAIEYGKRA
jgi:hypothetical protein